MSGRSRSKREISKKIDKEKDYTIEEAIGLLKELSKRKFKESFDISINLGVDPKKSDQVVRGASNLPHGNGKEVRVAVIAQGSAADEAEVAGADLVGFEDLAENIKSGEIDFDLLIATPDAMRLVGQLGKVLGPKGLMPNPKTGTVTADVSAAVKNAKSGQVQFRTDKAGIIHGSIGKIEFVPSAVKENLEALIADIKKAKPASSKGQYLRNMTLTTTMGPGLKIDQSSLDV